MTDFDLDRLGDVWRQQPDPAEMERLQKSAAAVARRARLSQVLDIGAAVAVSAAVILLVSSNPKLETVLIGAAAILVLLFSSIRLRKVRLAELRTLAGGTEDMLEQSIDRVETTLRYRRFSLIAVGPGVILSVMVVPLAQGRSPLSLLQGQPSNRYILMAVAALVLVSALVFAWRARGRGTEELERLKAMRDAYRRERESAGH